MRRSIASLTSLCLAATLGVSGQDGWNHVSPLNGARWLLAAATGPDGTIYVVGGLDRVGQLTRPWNELDAYDSATDTWSVRAPMPTPRYGLTAATASDGRIYAIGGSGRAGHTVEAFQPALNQWSNVVDLPTGRSLAAAATGSDGRLYVVGGMDADGRPLGTVEAYDPASATWATMASMPTPRYALAAATGADGRIYVMGGVSGAAALPTVESYDPLTNTWSPGANMPTARYGLGAVAAIDGRIYALGGGDLTAVQNVAESYEPASDSWSAVAPLRQARLFLAVATGGDGRVFAIGGTAGDSPVNGVEVYAAAGSDLDQTAISNPPAVLVLKEKFNVTDTVQNIGFASGATTTQYFLSLDILKDNGDKALGGKRAVPALAAGASSTGTAKVTVATNTKLGLYYLLACADASNTETETDETNNCMASATQVDVRAPDLIEAAVSNPPTSAPLGGSFTVGDTAVNQGNSASGPTTTRFYASLDTKKSGSDVLLTGTRLVPGLAPGASSPGSVVVTIPGSAALGTYYMIACADDLKKARESNEKNNCTASATKVTITSGSGSAVSIIDFAFVPQNLTVSAGALVRWTNNGGGPFHTSTSDSGLWGSASLAPGASFERTFSTAGSFPYHCAIHAGMTGTITVQ